MKYRKNIIKKNKKQNSNYRAVKINKRSKSINKIKSDNFIYSSHEKLLLKNQKYRYKLNKQKNSEKTFPVIFNSIIILLFIISYYFYYLSLEKCFKGEDGCSRKLNWIKLKLTQYIISVVLIIILFALIFYNIISKLHLFHFILIFICFYRYSHSVYFHDHGAYNLIGLFVVLFLSLIILLIFQAFFTTLTFSFKTFF